MRPLAFGHPNYQLPFFLFVCEKAENVLRAPTQKHGDHQRPVGYCSQQLDPVAQGYPPCVRAIPVTALLVKATE